MFEPLKNIDRNLGERIDIIMLLFNLFLLFTTQSMIFLGFASFNLVRMSLRQQKEPIYEFNIPTNNFGGIVSLVFGGVLISYLITSIPAISSTFSTTAMSLNHSWLLQQKGFAITLPSYLSNIMVVWIIIWAKNAFDETNFFAGTVPVLLEKHAKTKNKDTTKYSNIAGGLIASVFHLISYVDVNQLQTPLGITINFIYAFVFFYISIIMIRNFKNTAEAGVIHILTNLKIWKLI